MLLSILLGMILGFIFGFLFFIYYLKSHRAPDSAHVKEKIYTDVKGDQFKLIPIAYICPPSFNATTKKYLYNI